MRQAFLATVLAGFVAVTAASQTQIDAGAVFRVFLKDGPALPSYGETAVIGDRVVFTLLVGAHPSQSSLQLMSLPVDRVDLDRTQRYANAIRAAHYSATRGEVDYAAMTKEVQRVLNELTAIADPKKRLALAEDARKRLVEWSRTTYGYRGNEVRELTSLFDEVINELRAAAGESRVSLDLRMDAVPAHEPLLPMPGLSESIALAIDAANATDDDGDRVAILRAAAGMAEAPGAPADLRARVQRELELETKATAVYASLAAETRTRAEEGRKRNDAAAVTRAIESLKARDQELGRRRPQIIAQLTAELETMLASLKTHHDVIERYTRVRGALLAYERAIRPQMSGFDGTRPVLLALKELRYTSYERIVRAGARIKGFIEALDRVTPPEDLADVHSTFLSALRMADHACARGRMASAVVSKVIAEEASSSAAGALLLAAQAREQLVIRLYPPKSR